MKFNRTDWLRLLIMLAPDDGSGNGGGAGAGDPQDGGNGGGTEPDNGGGTGGKEDEIFDPSTKLDTKVKAKYWSQLNPKYQQDDFKDIDTIDKLYEGYRNLQNEVKSYDGAIKIPTKDSTPDEIKGFFHKIGMPEKEEDYQCDSFDLAEPVAAPLRDLFRKAAYRNGLTKGQALNMWAHEAATIQGFVTVAQQNTQKLIDSYEERYSNLLESEIPDATKRKERISEEANLVKAFNSATGLGEFFDKTGLSYNPNFMHALAGWYRKIDPAAILGNGPEPKGGKDVKMRDMYSSMDQDFS